MTITDEGCCLAPHTSQDYTEEGKKLNKRGDNKRKRKIIKR